MYLDTQAMTRQAVNTQIPGRHHADNGQTNGQATGRQRAGITQTNGQAKGRHRVDGITHISKP